MAEEKAKKQPNPAVKQSIIAVSVLVIICLVCGLLLALCNDLLYVSDDVKLSRAMRKIYSAYNPDEEFNKNFKIKEKDKHNSYGDILDVKKSTDDAYVITARGDGGYKGTITIYLVVKVEVDSNSKKDVFIKAWTIKEHDGETFLGNITSAHQKAWYVGKSVRDYEQPSFARDNNKVSGTTLSSTAINNAVKAACYYCIDGLGIASTPESEAKDAVVALLATKGEQYAGYNFTGVSDDDGFSEFKVGERDLSFYFEGTMSGADDLEAYVYGDDDNREIVVVKAGLTHSERLQADAVVAKSDNASDEVVGKVQSLSYFEYSVHKYYEGFEFAGMDEVQGDHATGANGTVNKVYKSTDGAIIIEATGNGGFRDGTVTINVVIANREIKGWWIVSEELQSYIDKITGAWDTVRNWYVGSSIDSNIALGDNKVTNATLSSTAINNAINTACNYARNTLD